jgi:N-acetylmuramoyl-L-alanine amidase
VLACAVAAAGLVAVAASKAATAAAGILDVRMGGDAGQTRLVLDLDHAASGRLESDGSGGRVVLLLPGVSAAGVQQGAGRGLVKRWAIDQAGGAARLQMDVATDSRVKRRFLLPPADGIDHYRYVIDVAKAPASDVRLAASPAKAGPARAGPARPGAASDQAATLPLRKVVVIDAGHGGHDPGARGALGFEKDVNLAAAQDLQARLERTGRYKVVMTRDADVYIPLADRVRIAQRAGADLFISLHSDSGPDRDIRGASVYTLSDKASHRAAQFVREDDWFMKASLVGRGVSDILLDLTQRATKNRSAAFADDLVDHIEGHAALLRRTHRDAGFEVLLAPEVPAVLLEMGFISNPDDEAELRDPAQRGELMDAVAKAIDEYFAQTTRLAAR